MQNKKSMKNSKNPCKPPKESSQHSVILQKFVSYSGPVSPKTYSFSPVFQKFRIDPLYCYPTLSYTSTKATTNQAIIPLCEFTFPEHYDLTEIINEICQQSPFKTLEHTSPEVTYSSLNTIEYGLERIDSEANRLNPAKRELVKQLLSEIARKEEFNSSECSVNLDISESLSFQTDQDCVKWKNSFSSVSSKSIFNVSESKYSIIPTNEEDIITCSKESYIVELLPEPTNEASIFKNSTEVSGIDEGSFDISTRIFLPKACASKNILNRTPKNGKNIKNFQIIVHDITLMSPETPSVMSPISRKLVMCTKCSKNFRTFEIKSCISCSGFVSCPSVEFSNLENESRGVIHSQENKITRLISERVASDLSERLVSWVTFGFEHCCLLTNTGELFSWGYGASGCLGHGSLLSCAFPTKIAKAPRCVYIESGAYHIAAISETEELYMWGRSDVNQLGINSKFLLKDCLGYFIHTPTKVEYFDNKAIKTVACGEAHTLVLDNKGLVYSFGWAEDGQLGLPTVWIKDNYMSFGPRQVVYLKHKKIVKVAAGAIFSTALTEAGEVFVWGNGELGQLGLGNELKIMEVPSFVKDLQNEVIADLACGEAHVVCVSKAGTVYGWGQGFAGIFENKGNAFPYGSDVVCYLPRRLVEFDISHRIVID